MWRHHSFLAQICPSCWSSPSCLATFLPLQTFLASLLDKPCRKREEKSFKFVIVLREVWVLNVCTWRYEVCFLQQQVLCGFWLLTTLQPSVNLPMLLTITQQRDRMCYVDKTLLTEMPETLLKDEPAGREELLFSSEAHASVWLGNVRLKGGWVTKQTVKQLLRSSGSQHFQYLRYLRLAEPFLHWVCTFLCQCFISASKEIEPSRSETCLSVLLYTWSQSDLLTCF